MCELNSNAILDRCRCQPFDSDVPIFGDIEVDYTEVVGWKPGSTWWAMPAENAKKIFYKLKLQQELWVTKGIPAGEVGPDGLSWMKGEQSILGQEAVIGWTVCFPTLQVQQSWTCRRQDCLYIYDFENMTQTNTSTKTKRKIRVVSAIDDHPSKRLKTSGSND
jgi:hypothetical protein